MAAETELERLVVRLVGDATSYQRMLRDSVQTTKKATNEIDRLGKRIQSVGNTIKGVGRSLTFRLTLPIVALGAAAIKVGADFDSGFAGVRKTVDATETELAGLRKEFKLLLEEIPTGATELLGIGEIAGQLGIATGNIASFTKTIAQLGAATTLTTEEAATSMAKFANVVGLSQDKFSNMGSALVALGNSVGIVNGQLATGEREIMAMSSRLVGAGNVIGLTTPQILGLAATLSALDIKAEAGGTAFSKLMIDIQTAVATGGKELTAFAKVASTSAKEFRKSFRDDAMGAITDLLRGLGKLEPEARILALKAIGVEGTRMTEALLKAIPAVKLLEDALASSETAFKENTALAKEAEQRFKTFWSQVKLLRNQVKLLLGEAFEQLEPMMRKMVARAKDLTAWFRDLSPAMKNTAMAALAVAAAIGPGLMGLGLLLGSSGIIIKAIVAIGAAFTAMGIKATAAWAAATLGVSLLIVVLIDFIRHWDEVKERLARGPLGAQHRMAFEAAGYDMSGMIGGDDSARKAAEGIKKGLARRKALLKRLLPAQTPDMPKVGMGAEPLGYVGNLFESLVSQAGLSVIDHFWESWKTKFFAPFKKEVEAVKAQVMGIGVLEPLLVGSARAAALSRTLAISGARTAGPPRPALQLGGVGGAVSSALGEGILAVLNQIAENTGETKEKTTQGPFVKLEETGLR